MMKFNYRYFAIFTSIFLVLCLMMMSKMSDNHTNTIMYSHMELSPMMWNSNNFFNAIISLMYFFLLMILIPKFNFFKSRWIVMMEKLASTNFYNISKEYMIISSLCLMIFLLNFYSLFSFNWIPNTQNWFMLITTTMFLFSIWLKMIFSGGVKIFGQKIPISWYMLNFALWCFHNLSFFIRFISLPFRMMMNLIVGMFLVDFAKAVIPLTSLVSIYEIFVMTVQTTVFIILANMYYSEMVMIPEWKSHKSTYNFNFNVKIYPWLNLMKIYYISFYLKF